MATRNRCQILQKTLDTFLLIQPPPAGWELIIVDNASTDDTPNLLASYAKRLPLTSLQCPRPGKNYALNAAIRHVHGDFVILTDDDILAQPDWLLRYAELAEVHPDYSIFGGRIDPEWPPCSISLANLSIPIGPAFAVHPADIPDGPIKVGMIWGPNMALRRSIFDNGYRFNPRIGPSPGHYVMGSETELLVRLAESGHRAWFSNSVVVRHQIRPQQLTLRWISGRAARFAHATSYDAHTTGSGTNRRMSRRLRWHMRCLAVALFQPLLHLIPRNKNPLFVASWQVSYHFTSVRLILLAFFLSLLRGSPTRE